jgi:hypothetical protein
LKVVVKVRPSVGVWSSVSVRVDVEGGEEAERLRG